MISNRLAGLFAALVLFLACGAAAQPVSLNDQLIAASLAPGGTLRVAFLGTNPIQGRVDPNTGAVSGPVGDIIRELSGRIGMAHEFMPQSGAQAVIDAVNSGAADLGFLAYEDSRAEQVDYAGPYATMASSYLVSANSPLQSSADVDTAGTVIGTVTGRSQEVFLSANIRNAEFEYWQQQPPDEEIERLLVSGELNAIGQNRQRSVEHAAKFPTLRVVDDAFFSVPQAFVMKQGETPKADALTQLMDELRGNGFVQASLEKANLLAGASVAPPGIP
jgi:polar amino acid transport system substrate-binding protein